MRIVKTVPIGGRDVTVKELTVGEIRAWLADMGADGDDVVSVALFEDATLADLSRMSDITAEEIAAAAPSELAAVLDMMRAVNKDFFSLRARLSKLGERALQEKGLPPPSED
jgi:hypothetical protein